MERYKIKDITPSKRKSKVILPRLESRPLPLREEFPKPPREEYIKEKKSKGLWIVAVVSVLICAFAVSLVFAHAAVVVVPKSTPVVLSENLSASSDESATDNLFYNLVVMPGQDIKILRATTEQDVSISATGKILLYNALGPKSQDLNSGTRLLGSNGKVYKTADKVTIPGMTGTLPGKVEVSIVASAPGPDYNSAPLDFTISGFSGTAKYSKFYGRSESPISGGFIGKAPAISDADKATAIASLKDELKNKLFQKIKDQIPPGFILFNNATSFNLDDSNIITTINPDNSMTLTGNGTLYGILFNEAKLTNKIAKDTISSYDGSDVYIPRIADLQFALGSMDGATLQDSKNINFNLSGAAQIVWKLDTDKFTADLLDRSKSDFTSILSAYPNIASAELRLSPPWKMTIPGDKSKIVVIVNYQK